MAKMTIARTNLALPENMDAARSFLFGALDGANKDDKRSWRRFWKKAVTMEPGECAVVEMRFERSGKFHRLHMAMEQAVFDSQERFEHFEQLRNWMKTGAGFVDWFPGPKGGIVPIPKSVAYSNLDDVEFHKVHEDMIQFLLTPHAGKVLWPHLDVQQRGEMVMAVLGEFL